MNRFSTIEELLKASQEVRTDESKTFADFVELRDYLVNNQDQIRELIEPLTLKQLSKFYRPMCSGQTKERQVKAFTELIIESFGIGDGCYEVDYRGGETSLQALVKRVFSKQTAEDLVAYKKERREKSEALKKCLTNPETLEEFRTFVTYKGMDGLTSEQKIMYDKLVTDSRLESREYQEKQRAQLAAVNLEGVEFSFHETVHTIKRHPLWVIQLTSRVDRDKYKELEIKARTLGGYYSGYTKNGAIPGFTFDKEDNARAFFALQSGKVDASEIIAERKAERQLTRAENMRAKADAMEAEANEILGRDRKTNTERRARMASSAERSALAQIEFAQTFRAIADALDMGEVRYIDKLTYFTDLDELQSIISKAKWDYIRKAGIRSEDYEFTPAVIEHAEIPFPWIWKDTRIHNLLQDLHKEKGKKMAAARVYKRLAALKTDREYILINTPKLLEDYKTLFCDHGRVMSANKYDQQRFKSSYDRIARIQRMGIENLPMLRTALRELVALNKIKLDPEVLDAQKLRELERSFVGRNIPGFFPTGDELAAETVELAEIQPGDVIGEPSAGLGHLAEAIQAAHPDNELHLIEIYHPLVEALRLKGFNNVVQGDFLKYTGSFDVIVMNPPFENMADIDHVRHAFSLLKPGGRLVAIMVGNKNGDRAPLAAFREFVEQYGYMKQNEPGAFLSAFRPTGVNTVTVVLRKPKG